MNRRYIRPCPFCGCQSYVHKTDYPSGDVGYRIGGWHNNDCYMDKYFPCFDAEKDAIDAWNRRAGDD